MPLNFLTFKEKQLTNKVTFCGSSVVFRHQLWQYSTYFRFTSEAPHLSKLPDNLLQVIGHQLQVCGEKLMAEINTETLAYAQQLTQCLIVVCRCVCNEFGYYEHPAVKNRISSEKRTLLIDINVWNVQIKLKPLIASKFLRIKFAPFKWNTEKIIMSKNTPW